MFESVVVHFMSETGINSMILTPVSVLVIDIAYKAVKGLSCKLPRHQMYHPEQQFIRNACCSAPRSQTEKTQQLHAFNRFTRTVSWM